MIETQLIEIKDLREQVIDKIEVLDKVKKLFLIPEMDVMTMTMIAKYYDVDYKVIQKCYERNRLEINTDGVCHKSLLDMMEFSTELRKRQNVSSVKESMKISYEFTNGIKLEVPNAGIKVFPKRAILRIGMLLRDSIIAKEVRTQLLNVFEHSTDEQRTTEIDEELRLKTNIGIAYANGDMDALTKANLEYNSYKNRYIKQIEDENITLFNLNGKLKNKNDELETTNALLSRKAIEWGNRPILNALIIKYAIVCFHGKYRYSDAWNALYRQVKYNCGWDIKARKGKGSLVDRIKENEFPDIIKIAVGLCERNHIDVGKTVNEINVENIKKFQ